MIQVLSESNNHLIATKASGTLDENDYDKIKTVLKEQLQKSDDINWYFEMDNLEGWTIEAMWEDLKLDIKLRNKYNKIAMVGEEKWQKWLTQLAKPFTTAEVKFFKLNEKEIAKNWISKI